MSASEPQNNSKWFAGDKLLVRGEALIAIVGIALAAIITAGIGASGWWTLRNQRESLDFARREQVRSVSGILREAQNQCWPTANYRRCGAR